MNAEERIENEESQRLYRKVGKKYVPASDPWAYNGLRDGWWLVKVHEGVSIRLCLFPAKAELQAAIRDKEDKLVEIIRQASEARPQRRPLSDQARKDWDWFISRNGKEFNTLEYPSFQENAENILKALLER